MSPQQIDQVPDADHEPDADGQACLADRVGQRRYELQQRGADADGGGQDRQQDERAAPARR
jgi:hypothetical protein